MPTNHAVSGSPKGKVLVNVHYTTVAPSFFAPPQLGVTAETVPDSVHAKLAYTSLRSDLRGFGGRAPIFASLILESGVPVYARAPSILFCHLPAPTSNDNYRSQTSANI